MKTIQTETTHAPKPRGYRFWLIRFALLLGLPMLFYYGYCWGLWGRNSLLLQYLFQCNCPAASEETRYSQNVDVIVPACKYLESLHAPSGRLLYVLAKESGTASTYLLNLETGEKTFFTLPDEGSNYFLTDNLVFHSFHGDDEYILDISTGIKYPIRNANQLEPSIYSMGNIAPHLLLDALSNADQIFLIKDVFQPVVVLYSDFHNHTENNFTFNALDFSADETNPVELFLEQNKIAHYQIPGRYPGELMSPDGRFIARADGIYLIATGQKIVEGYSVSRGFYGRKYFSVRGWAYDSSGAFYTTSEACLIVVIFPPFEAPGCVIEIPQPMIKVKVPEEYLLPAPVP